jgi:hypothetical protein
VIRNDPIDPIGTELPTWVKEGAVFAVDGSNEKIIRITAQKVDVVTWDSFGWWAIRGFLAAIASGRITRPANANRVKRRTSASPADRSSRGPLPEVAEHLTSLPITAATPAPKSVLLALRGLRSGDPVRSPDIILVEALAYAGAYADGLGPTVAFRKGRRGRFPILQPEARDAQALLDRFSQWLLGNGELELNDFRVVEHFVRRGLEAYGLIPPSAAAPRRGRPRGIQYDKDVRQELILRWSDHRRGKYSIRKAIEEIAREVVLQQKKVIAAWNDEAFDSLKLGPEDEEKVGKTIGRIARAYYRRPKPTEKEVAAHRR